jgi:hypothetical protein
MTPTQVDTLLFAVKDLREDMGDRFEHVRLDLAEVKGQLKLVDGRVGKVELAEAVAAALVAAAKVNADQKVSEAGLHVLAYRWRVGIVIAAVGATLAAIGQILSGLRLFGFGQ